MRGFQCAAFLAVLAVASSQYVSGGGGLLPPRKHMSDSALNKFLSVVRGGGRGHRELLSLTGSASSPAYATLQPASGPLAGPPGFSVGIGRLPPSVTHVPAPPKVGAFYITPPERNAPSFYGGLSGRRPQLVKISELQNARPSFSLLTSETSNRPSGILQQGPPVSIQQGPGIQGPPQQTVQYYQVNAAPGAPNGIPQQFLARPVPQGLPPQFLQGPPQQSPQGLPPQFLSGAPQQTQQVSIGQNVVQTGGPGEAQSLQEIIAKAAQQQHAKVLEKEQKAHPTAQITNSQILVPGAGQQPVFLNQFGQPFLAPAIFGGQPQQAGGAPPQLVSNGQGQFMLIQGPPQQIPQQLRQQLPQQLRQQQAQPQLNSVTGEVPEQLVKGQTTIQEQQIPLQFINAGGLHIPQGQSISYLPGHPGSAPRGVQIPFGAAPQQFQGFAGGQVLNLPPGLLQGNIDFAGLRGSHGSLVPGNSILGQSHFALVGNSGSQGENSQFLSNQGQNQQQENKSADKEEQPTRQLESASQQVIRSVSPVPLTSGHGHMTAAIMQSQVEINEPIHKI